MNKSSKNVIIAVVVVVLLVAIYGISVSMKRGPTGERQNPVPTPSPITTPEPSFPVIDASKVVYDAKKTIPGTEITVSFPKDGYNGSGVTLGQSADGSLMQFQKVNNLYILSKPNDYPEVEVGIYKLGNEKTLNDVVATMTKDQPPAAMNGDYQTVNGTRYFIQREADGSEIYAYALINGQLLNVNMQRGFAPKSASTPDLFTQFLAHIDFSCKGDCSVNAEPVVNTGKPEDGE